MTRTAKKITEKSLAKMIAPDPSGRQTLHWDSDLKGFAVLCSGVSTTRTFVVQKDRPNGKSRRLTVAKVNELPLLEARDRAADLLDQLRRGIDPKLKVENPTLKWALENYLAARKTLRPASIRAYRQIEKKLADWLDKPVRDITAAMVEARHRALAAETGEFTANAIMRAFRIMWNFASNRAAENGDDYGRNPVRRLSTEDQWYDEPERKRIVKTEDLPKFYQAVTQLENQIARDYFLLLLFTGMRRTEAATLRWEYIDLTGRVIHLPDTTTKTDCDLNLPMSDFVRDLLVARQAQGRDKFVFPGRGKSGHFSDTGRPLADIAKACGVKISAHDLRRTFITCAENTANIPAIAPRAMVNHTLGKDVHGKYIQMSIEDLREPVRLVADRLKTLCGIAPLPATVAKLKA